MVEKFDNSVQIFYWRRITNRYTRKRRGRRNIIEKVHWHALNNNNLISDECLLTLAPPTLTLYHLLLVSLLLLKQQVQQIGTLAIYLALTLVLNWRLDSNLISSRVYDNLMMIRSVQFIIKAPSIHTPPHPACFNLLLVTHPLTYTHSKAPP